MPDFDSFTRISYTIDFSAFCSVGLAGFVGGELSLSEEKGLRLELGWEIHTVNTRILFVILGNIYLALLSLQMIQF